MAAFQDVDPGSAPGHRNPLLNKCVFYSIQINGEICRAKITIMTLSKEKILDMKYIIFNNEKDGFSNKISTLTHVLAKTLNFPRRELNPALLGESQLS